MLRVNSARNLALSVYKAVRDSSSPAAPRNDRLNEFSHGLHLREWKRTWRTFPLPHLASAFS
ncbi:hypothetical protein SBA2_100061 [Acidobacteriia bacterium SbA2]|nr:hypothetical protein SBA2_100061 [Acidobacteriia bacterium SbA2]